MQKTNTFYKNYELLDIGDFRKLESFSGVVVDRPAPNASAKKTLPDAVWENADAFYDGKEWDIRTGKIQTGWTSVIDTATIELKLSTAGQVGVFPEQAANWKWIKDAVLDQKRTLKVFNGFGYTGVSSLFASSKTSSVCHLDASKSAVSWAKRNVELSGLADNDIRWLVDDVMTFLGRELKRGVKYDAFILDPPAFGRTKDGKTWSLKKDLPLLLELTGLLLSKEPAFFVLSCHDPLMSTRELSILLNTVNKGFRGRVESFEMVLGSNNGAVLKSGLCARVKLL